MCFCWKKAHDDTSSMQVSSLFIFFWLACTLWKFILLHRYEVCTFLTYLSCFEKFTEKLDISLHFIHYRWVKGPKCTPTIAVHRHLKCPWNQKTPLVPGGIPPSIYILWLRWLSTQGVLIKSLGGRGCWLLLTVLQAVSDPVSKVYDKS